MISIRSLERTAGSLEQVAGCKTAIYKLQTAYNGAGGPPAVRVAGKAYGGD